MRYVDLSGEPDQTAFDRMREHADEIQAGLDLREGPVLRAAVFDLGAGRGRRLLLAVHHLVVDGVSWRILLEDLGAAYESLAAGANILLPVKTTSFQEWANLLREYAASAEALAELPYWESRPAGGDLPRLRPGPTTAADAHDLSFTLDEQTTDALLREVPRAFGTQINDVLIAALAAAVRTWTGSPLVRLDLEGHGREELFPGVDLSRTVGWFTSLFPVTIPLEEAEDVADVLDRTRDALAEIPNKGVGYGILRHLGGEDARHALRAHPAPEIGFNYLGRFGAALPGLGRYADEAEPTGRESGPDERRPHLLDVDAATEDGRLSVRIRAALAVLGQPAVTRFAAEYERNLRTLISRARTGPRPAAPTVGDFPLANLDEAQLAMILEGLNR